MASTSSGDTITKDIEDTFLLEARQLRANCASTRVLQWPCIRDISDSSGIDELFFSPARPEEPMMSADSPGGRGICEEDIPALIDRFLRNVHTKNPILDTDELRKMCRRVREDGFDWNAPSCLILIGCALGAIARPFAVGATITQSTSRQDAPNYGTAESYYNAARKRIGLLDTSIVTIQCAFLIGVYEMYSMRPLRAWLSFNRACTHFQTYLHSAPLAQPAEQSSTTIISRLFWSCLKSDCEMREEIPLSPTELARVEYSVAFPLLPDGALNSECGDQPEPLATLDASSERSWYYYLSEVASRRIANRINATLHLYSPEEWMKTPVDHLQRIAEELDAQITQWGENLPPSFRVRDDVTVDELSYFLHSRYLEYRERIWRPFLYLAAHSSSQHPDLPMYVQGANTCIGVIFEHVRHHFNPHRHHGSWFEGRNLFTMGLLILVAAKTSNITMPSDWTTIVDTCITNLMYWEDEAIDLRAARLTLQNIYNSIVSPVPDSGNIIE